ncbi:MAG: response regulator [Candidatus Eisenbacteria bacterium]|uniref:Response regulator n=1 Tax=Eiseniibacteriota bacterium TaxID=2212470 RepID=A0A956NB60_UNCEI|nr:response regulator [Candidatus Eisenbacteria bacterium]MCB9466250.1 response regulator [Candidatus Eisenbacteria bacterium]
MKVLFVDDDSNLLSGLRRSLRNEPFSILVAESAKDALSLLEKEDIDVLVADDRMPGMLGTELLQHVRESHPDVLRILMTGYADFETAMRAINEGAVFRFLTKPCKESELLIALHAALHQRELLLENRRLLDLMRRRRDEVRELREGASGLRGVVKDDSGAIVIGGVLDDLSSIVQQMEEEVQDAERRLAAQEKRFGRQTRNDQAA